MINLLAEPAKPPEPQKKPLAPGQVGAGSATILAVSGPRQPGLS